MLEEWWKERRNRKAEKRDGEGKHRAKKEDPRTGTRGENMYGSRKEKRVSFFKENTFLFARWRARDGDNHDYESKRCERPVLRAKGARGVRRTL